MEHSLAARGDLWRVEASTSNSPARDDSSSLFLLQLGPLLFLRDSTLLLPVHLSKQHLLWYGYDRKVCLKLQPYYLLSQWMYDCVTCVSLCISSVCLLFQNSGNTHMVISFQKGMHSLCPALWSKHRRWLMMSMFCLNPLDCVSVCTLKSFYACICVFVCLFILA